MFDFGENWEKFSKTLTPDDYSQAITGLKELVGNVEGKSFIDVGCGSGIVSIAANSLSAEKVLAIDVNPRCISVSKQNLENIKNWDTRIVPEKVAFKEFSILDDCADLGKFDVVYSWGVLHHTGDMYKSFSNIISLVKPGGLLAIAIYNKHSSSQVWRGIKWLFNKSPGIIKRVLFYIFLFIKFLGVLILQRKNPLRKERGMHFYYDVYDWIGGYPYEFADIDEVCGYFQKNGFTTEKVYPTAGFTGCNEYVFRKVQKMCGIVGFNWTDEGLVKEANDTMRHRGPDQSGIYTDNNVSLAHRRLSILDLSENGRQPMSNETGSVRIVFNGEIFNYRELREELINKGHIFVSHTDTEVLVHLYEEMGEEMLGRLDGQFAFCIYDTENDKLFIARDRLGILPVYYYLHEGKFVFASELKALMATGIEKEIDVSAVEVFFRFSYIAAPACILKNTKKLEAAHYIIFDINTRKIKAHKRYWELSFGDTLSDKKNICSKMLNILDESVKKRLIADVPVGAFLSGGVDSSAVVALIKKHKQKLKTFSIKFDYKEYDESRFARKTAEGFGTEHYEIDFSHKDVRGIIPKLVYAFDEPFGDPSAIPTYLVSKIAREHVIVSLSGDGGDELLGGYNRYRYFKVLRFLNVLPPFVKGTLRFLLNIVIGVCPKFEIERIRELLSFGKLPDAELFEKLCEKIDRTDLNRLLKRKCEFVTTTNFIKEEKGLDALRHFDIVNYLDGDILTKVDRASMASSLETRPPMLDHRFVEFCLSIKKTLMIKGWTGKWIFKEALKGLIPKEILTRKKMGFGVPLKHYFKNELNDLLVKYVFEYEGHDLFDREFLMSMSEKGKLRDTTRLYWNVMMFNMWYERWMG